MAEIKTQTYSTQEEALRQMTNAYKVYKDLVRQRNVDDPDLNETVTVSTDETNKRYTLTRPDQQEGVQVIHYCWT